MGNIKSRINEYIFIKTAESNQAVDLKIDNLFGNLPADYYIFLHRIYDDKTYIEELILKLQQRQQKRVIKQLLNYYYITKNEYLFNRIRELMNKLSLVNSSIIDEELVALWELKEESLSLLFIARFLDYKHLALNHDLWEIRVDKMVSNLKPNSPLVRLKHSLLFIWLQDLNWSGSKKVYEYLLSIPLNRYKEYLLFITDVFIKYNVHDIGWLYFMVQHIKNRKDIAVTTVEFDQLMQSIDNDSIETAKHLYDLVKRF